MWICGSPPESLDFAGKRRAQHAGSICGSRGVRLCSTPPRRPSTPPVRSQATAIHNGSLGRSTSVVTSGHQFSRRRSERDPRSDHSERLSIHTSLHTGTEVQPKGGRSGSAGRSQVFHRRARRPGLDGGISGMRVAGRSCASARRRRGAKTVHRPALCCACLGSRNDDARLEGRALRGAWTTPAPSGQGAGLVRARCRAGPPFQRTMRCSSSSSSRAKAGVLSRSRAMRSTALITVVWCLPPKPAPITG